MKDTWEITKNNLRKWRWRRITENGDVVGASPRGYKNKADCEANASYNGWGKEDTRDQVLVETLTRKASEQRQNGESPDLDDSMDATGVEHQSVKARFVSKPFIHENLLKLIATFLGLMLLVLILILLRRDPTPEFSIGQASATNELLARGLAGSSDISAIRLAHDIS